jgi:hypothetical protein
MLLNPLQKFYFRLCPVYWLSRIMGGYKSEMRCDVLAYGRPWEICSVTRTFVRQSAYELHFPCVLARTRKESVIWPQSNCACDLKSDERSFEWWTDGHSKPDGSTTTTTKKTAWFQSASEPYRPRDRNLSASLVPTFADRGCRVVSATNPQCR